MSLVCPSRLAVRASSRALRPALRRHNCAFSISARCYSSSSSSANRSRTPAQLLTLLGALGALAVVLGTPTNKEQARLTPLNAEAFNTYPLRSSSQCTSPSQPHHSGDGAHVLLDVILPTPSIVKDALCIQTLYLAHPDIQVQRAYTPLYAASAGAQLLIKRYASGEVGRYAHSLRAGDQVWLRGPEKSWIAKGDEQDLLLIAGGTGITPMYQLITTLLGPPSLPASPKVSSSTSIAPTPRLTLLYASQRSSSLLLLPELEALREAHPELDVRLWVEEDDVPSSSSSSSSSFFSSRRRVERGMPLRVGRLNAAEIKSVKRPKQDVLLCGPDAMIAALAGPKARDGKGQGALRGVLLQLGYEADRVCKL